MKTVISGRRLGLISVVALLIVTLAGLVRLVFNGEHRSDRLPDGAKLVLTQIRYGAENEFTHGKTLEKLLGNVIPARGIRFAGIQLQRPSHEPRIGFGKPEMAVEFKLIATNAASHPLVGFNASAQFRVVIGGTSGMEYSEQFWWGRFGPQRDGYFGYVRSSCFPRDSKWLDFRIEQRAIRTEPWRTAARFRVKNPARSVNLPWAAGPPSIVTMTNGMECTLGEITVEAKPALASRTVDAMISVPFRIRTNGLPLLNWTPAAYPVVEDATGNWGSFGTTPVSTNGDWTIYHGRSLDPRSVWKLEVDFAPQSGIPVEDLLTFQVPVHLSSPIRTNFFGVALKVSWVNQNMLAVEMPTNRTDLRLLFVGAHDHKRRDLNRETGNWGQYHFWRSLDLSEADDSIEATIAIVPNVHASYLVKPTVFQQSKAER